MADKEKVLTMLKQYVPVREISKTTGVPISTVYYIRMKNKIEYPTSYSNSPTQIKKKKTAVESKITAYYANTNIRVSGEILNVYDKSYAVQLDDKSNKLMTQLGLPTYRVLCRKKGAKLEA